jgi:hypothetical protein
MQMTGDTMIEVVALGGTIKGTGMTGDGMIVGIAGAIDGIGEMIGGIENTTGGIADMIVVEEVGGDKAGETTASAFF